jgi:predicted Zn-dependent protease
LLHDGSLTEAERMLERATLHYPVAPDAFALLGEAAARRGHRAAAASARAKQAALSGP